MIRKFSFKRRTEILVAAFLFILLFSGLSEAVIGYKNSSIANHFKDWRNADACWYAKVDDSGAGGHFNDNAQMVIAEDGTWICAWTTGTSETAADMHIGYKTSTDHGKTWSQVKAIEPATETITAAYGYLFKSPLNGRIFSFYRLHDKQEIKKELQGTSMKNVLGHFYDTVGYPYFRYSDDNGKTWSKRHKIPTRRTEIDNPEGPLAGWFYGIGPVIIGDQVWFSVNKTQPFYSSRWETWFYVSPNLHTESDPAKFIWKNKPEGEVGVVPNRGLPYWVEASLVQLQDPNHMYCVARNRYAGYLGQSFSIDGGNTWQNPPSAAQYWDGSGVLHNPKAGPMLKQLSDGTYFLTFYNDRARADDVVHWSKLYDRSPLWCAVGWRDGNVLKFSQPEILLYNDQDVTASAEGNRSSVYAPFLFEADGKVFTVYSNKKTDVQIAQIPWPLINGLKNQRKANTIKQENLLLSLGTNQLKSKEIVAFTENHFKPLDKAGSFSVEFRVRFRDAEANQTLLDTRNNKGQGLWIGLTKERKIRIELVDRYFEHQFAQSAENLITAGKLHHVIVTVDGASDTIIILIDGVISGDNPRKNFKEMGHVLTDINGSTNLYLGRPSAYLKSSKIPLNGQIRKFRLYDHYLTTCEAISNYRFGL